MKNRKEEKLFWRHQFKTFLRQVGSHHANNKTLLDYICGYPPQWFITIPLQDTHMDIEPMKREWAERVYALKQAITEKNEQYGLK